MALPGEHGLGDAVAPHGAGGGTVGEHGPAVALQIVAGIQLGEGAHALGHHAVAVGGISALVGKGLKLPGHQCAVGPDIGDDVGTDGMADTVGDKRLLPAALQLHQMSAHLGGAPGAKRLIQGVLLVAEAAADVGLDEPDLAPGNSQGLPHDPADNVGDLGGADHHYPASLHIGKAAVVLNVAVLDRGGIVPALHADQARFLPGLFIIALADIRVLEHVAGELLVDLGGVRLHGLLHIQHEGQLLILHLQRPDGLGGGNLVLRDDHRYVIAVVADMAVQQQPVRHVLVGGVRGPGMARCGKGDVGYVKAGQNTDHAGNALRRGGVDGLDKAVGNGGVADLGHVGAPVAQIVHVFGPSGGLFIGVHTDDAFADTFVHRACLLME